MRSLALCCSLLLLVVLLAPGCAPSQNRMVINRPPAVERPDLLDPVTEWARVCDLLHHYGLREIVEKQEKVQYRFSRFAQGYQTDEFFIVVSPHGFTKDFHHLVIIFGQAEKDYVPTEAAMIEVEGLDYRSAAWRKGVWNIAGSKSLEERALSSAVLNQPISVILRARVDPDRAFVAGPFYATGSETHSPSSQQAEAFQGSYVVQVWWGRDGMLALHLRKHFAMQQVLVLSEHDRDRVIKSGVLQVPPPERIPNQQANRTVPTKNSPG